MSKGKKPQCPFIQRFAEAGFSPEGDKSMPVSVSHRNQERAIPKPGGRHKLAQDHLNTRILEPQKITEATKVIRAFTHCVVASQTNEAESMPRRNFEVDNIPLPT